MSIKKYLIISILTIVLMTIVSSTFISSRYIDDYFKNYISDQYNQNVKRILEISANSIENQDFLQIRRNLNAFIEDPIVGISIKQQNDPIVSVQDRRAHMHMMMRGEVKTDVYEIVSSDDRIIGELEIFRADDIQDFQTIVLFKRALFSSNMRALFISGVIGILAILYVSKKIDKDLKDTAEFAGVLENDGPAKIDFSPISEIKVIQQSLIELSARLGLKNTIRKEQADKLSHEVRTPITILKANLEGVSDGILEMDRQRLETCISQIDTLDHLLMDINKILSYEASEIKTNIISFDLMQELNHIVKGFRPEFNKKNISLNLTGPSAILVKSDKQLINQAIYNLITNALKFTPEDGEVIITAYQNEKEYIIEIKDSGIGIHMEDIGKLFDAYFRGKNTASSFGKGLGLYISANNIKALGGEISAGNNKDKGAWFRIILKRDTEIKNALNKENKEN